MKQLELDLFNDTVPSVCPFCLFGEVIQYPEDEYYTAGYTCICDCGYSTVQPKMTYEQFATQCDDILSRRREVIRLGNEAEQRRNRLQVGVSGATWNPRREEATITMYNYQRTEQALWNEYARLCRMYTYYSCMYDVARIGVA